MLAFRCQCGCLQGWFDHPDVTKVVEFDQQWKHCAGQARIIVAPTREQIDEAAYLLWDAAGRPVSDGKEFWYQAEEKLKGGVVTYKKVQVGYSSAMTWPCPKCGTIHKRGHNADKDYKPLYEEKWVGPCSCGKSLGDSPYSYCLDCARKQERKKKKGEGTG